MGMNLLTRGCVAEFVGTFLFVLFGVGSIVLTKLAAPGEIPAGSLLTVAVAHGLALSLVITATMYISGGQINPAVSIGLLSIGKQSVRQTGAFIASQLLGAACAAGMLVFLLGTELTEPVKLGATLGRFSSGEERNVLGVFGLEFLMTFALMFIVLAAVVDERAHKLGGFCIGLIVATCIVAFGPLTGASMNPARSFGPALYGYWDMHWVYWLAPIGGAVAAAFTYRVVWEERGEPEREVPPLREDDARRKGS
jgi:MIP family channel proteins